MSDDQIPADDLAPTPVVVPASANVDQLSAALRYLAGTAAGWMVAKGWLTHEIAAALIPVILFVWPLVWSQLKVRANHRRLITLATAVPDSVAVVQK